MASPRAVRRRSARRTGALVASALLLAVLTEQAPHTVHHLFDDDGPPETACEFATAHEREHGVAVTGVALGASPAIGSADPGSVNAALPPRAPRCHDARAPPRPLA